MYKLILLLFAGLISNILVLGEPQGHRVAASRRCILFGKGCGLLGPLCLPLDGPICAKNHYGAVRAFRSSCHMKRHNCFYKTSFYEVPCTPGRDYPMYDYKGFKKEEKGKGDKNGKGGKSSKGKENQTTNDDVYYDV